MYDIHIKKDPGNEVAKFEQIDRTNVNGIAE